MALWQDRGKSFNGDRGGTHGEGEAQGDTESRKGMI